jgi:hypothetical protein
VRVAWLLHGRKASAVTCIALNLGFFCHTLTNALVEIGQLRSNPDADQPIRCYRTRCTSGARRYPATANPAIDLEILLLGAGNMIVDPGHVVRRNYRSGGFGLLRQGVARPGRCQIGQANYQCLVVRNTLAPLPARVWIATAGDSAPSKFQFPPPLRWPAPHAHGAIFQVVSSAYSHPHSRKQFCTFVGSGNQPSLGFDLAPRSLDHVASTRTTQAPPCQAANFWPHL